MDPFGRRVDYLRISITDRCNERCVYCMPEGFKDWQQKADQLTDDQIIQVVEAAAELGFTKFRITGGEPLVRRGVPGLVARMRRVPGVRTICMTSNGTLLAEQAEALVGAGLDAINLSLDALDPEIYGRITRGRVEDVLAGIHAVLRAGISSVKLNAVLMKGVNEGELWPLVKYAAPFHIRVRFIEQMPLSVAGVLDADRFLSVEDAKRILMRAGAKLTPVPDRYGNGPARYQRVESPELGPRGVEAGFIGAMTQEHFCESCNKMRLTADGMIRPCLGNHGELDMKPALRSGDAGAVRAALLKLFKEAIDNKPEQHTFNSGYQPLRIMTAIGG